MYVCTICNLFAGQTFSKVLRHMGSTHRFDAGLSIRCGIDFCPEQYKNFESFRSHIYRKHREVLVTGSAPAETFASSGLAGDQQEDEETDDMEVAHGQKTCNDDIKRSAALFLLKTREERKVTQTALNGIVQDIQGL